MNDKLGGKDGALEQLRTWDDYFRALMAYQKKHGSTSIAPVHYNNSKFYRSLHSWVKHQQVHQHLMTEEQKSMWVALSSRSSNTSVASESPKEGSSIAKSKEKASSRTHPQQFEDASEDDEETEEEEEEDNDDEKKEEESSVSDGNNGRARPPTYKGSRQPTHGPRTSYCFNHKAQWDIMFNELKEYKKIYGDCNVPVRYADNPPLGKWVSRQRETHKRLQLAASRVERLNSIGFVWQAAKENLKLGEQQEYINTWMNRFKLLKKIKKDTGTCKVPQDHEDKTFRVWVLKQKHARGRMKAERRALLEEIGFWEDMDPTTTKEQKEDEDWNSNYNLLKKYKEGYGTCDVPEIFNKELFSWVAAQRHARFRMPHKRQEMLENIGLWKDQDEKDRIWMDNFQRLKRYKEMVGTCRVHSTFPDNEFREWAFKQNTPNLSADQKQFLTTIGFWEDMKNASKTPETPPVRVSQTPVENGMTDEWRANFQRLRAIKMQTGTCRLPPNFTDQKFRDWVNGLLTTSSNLSSAQWEVLQGIAFWKDMFTHNKADPPAAFQQQPQHPGMLPAHFQSNSNRQFQQMHTMTGPYGYGNYAAAPGAMYMNPANQMAMGFPNSALQNQISLQQQSRNCTKNLLSSIGHVSCIAHGRSPDPRFIIPSTAAQRAHTGALAFDPTKSPPIHLKNLKLNDGKRRAAYAPNTIAAGTPPLTDDDEPLTKRPRYHPPQPPTRRQEPKSPPPNPKSIVEDMKTDDIDNALKKAYSQLNKLFEEAKATGVFPRPIPKRKACAFVAKTGLASPTLADIKRPRLANFPLTSDCVKTRAVVKRLTPATAPILSPQRTPNKKSTPAKDQETPATVSPDKPAPRVLDVKADTLPLPKLHLVVPLPSKALFSSPTGTNGLGEIQSFEDAYKSILKDGDNANKIDWKQKKGWNYVVCGR